MAVGMLFVASCGSGGGSDVAVPIFSEEIGGAGESVNGLAFAAPGDTVSDLSGESLTVIVPRFVADYVTGTTRFAASEETLTVGTASAMGLGGDLELTIGGERLTFVGGLARDASGRRWVTAPVTVGTASATTTVYSYSFGAGAVPMDSEGIFVAGFETDPAALDAISTTLRFDGTWFGYGVLLDGTRALDLSEVEGGGLISLTADLPGQEIDGQMTGSFVEFGDVSATILAAPIQSGGFLADVSLHASGGNSNTAIAGRFYGSGPEDISGLIAFDEWRTIDGEARRLLAPAGFTAEHDSFITN